jgi:hypothetical protein
LLPSKIKSQAVIPEEALNKKDDGDVDVEKSDLWWPAMLTALHVIPGENINIVLGFEKMINQLLKGKKNTFSTLEVV